MENIGRYKIISELGRGGMATVFQATDPRFERNVAIKVLPQAFLHDPQFRARFVREAKMIAALEHASIVPVYDFGEEHDQPYIVMRMMSGGSLADKLRGGKLSIEEAAQVVARVASGLDAAHQKGIIHRDLKPGNILFDQYNNAFLSDFGIARLAETSAALTGSNILGTPAYMSPEQVQGDKDIDGRSDIYALGVIFYQMLVGNTPYQATTPAKVMMMHILEPVPNLMDMLPDVTPAVEAWFGKVLAKEPDARFSTAGEMASRLQVALRDNEPPSVEVPTLQSVHLQDQTVFVPPAAQMTPTNGTPPPSTLPPSTPPPSTSPPFTPPPMTAYPSRVYEQPSKSRLLPYAIIGLGLFGILAIGVIAVVFLGYSGSGPLALLAPSSVTPMLSQAATPTTEAVVLVVMTETPVPIIPTETPVVELIEVASDTPEPTVEAATATNVPPTETPAPTLTPTLEALVIGGADKIAFVNDDEIWVMNVDGSDLKQLTEDGAEKFRLGWTPDGSAVTYISGKCVWAAEYESGEQELIVCFESAKYVDEFSISSDGTQVAISRDLELFVVPYDRERLAAVQSRSDLMAMSECEVLAPLITNTGSSVAVTQVRWSNDDTKMAIKVLAPENGIQVDLIRFTDISNCKYTDNLDEFPATRFKIDGYDKTPYIQNLGYDGISLFSMTSYARNDGFGHLYIYNHDLHRADTQVNPIDGKCCYRDPQFSPDGRYLIFAHQPYEAGAKTQLYYMLFASLGTGANLEPIPLPDDFLTEAKAKPQPAFRPAAGQ